MVVEPALSWLRELRKTDRSTAQQVGAALTVLAEEGPALGRPLVDTVHGSRLRHLKELRPGSSGASEVRLLFVFDPTAVPWSWSRATSRADGTPGTPKPFRWPRAHTRSI